MKDMKPLTPEQIEYISLKETFNNFSRVYKSMRERGEIGCFNTDLPSGYPRCKTIFETFVYQRLEQLKQEKLKG